MHNTILPTGLKLHTDLVLNERYRLVAKVGRGGSARVWRAQHVLGDHDLALKFVEPGWTHLGVDEFRLLTQLHHPNVVRILEMGPVTTLSEGVLPRRKEHFITMEFIKGKTFLELIEGEAEVQADEVVIWLRQMVEVLRYLHGMRVLHRDIKPGNLMVDESTWKPRAVLIDFNISELDDPSAGTPAYKCPLVAQELRWTRFSDIWALAVSFYELLTGRFLFESEPELDLVLNGQAPDGFPSATFEAIKTVIRCDTSVRDVDLDHYRDVFRLPEPVARMDRLPRSIETAWGISSRNHKLLILQMLNSADRAAPRSRAAIAREALRAANRPSGREAVAKLERSFYALKTKGVIDYCGNAKRKKVVLSGGFLEAVRSAI